MRRPSLNRCWVQRPHRRGTSAGNEDSSEGERDRVFASPVALGLPPFGFLTTTGRRRSALLTRGGLIVVRQPTGIPYGPCRVKNTLEHFVHGALGRERLDDDSGFQSLRCWRSRVPGRDTFHARRPSSTESRTLVAFRRYDRRCASAAIQPPYKREMRYANSTRTPATTITTPRALTNDS